MFSAAANDSSSRYCLRAASLFNADLPGSDADGEARCILQHPLSRILSDLKTQIKLSHGGTRITVIMVMLE